MSYPETDQPVADTAAEIEYTIAHDVPEALQWSYDAEPTNGGITIVVGGVTKWAVDITAAGPGFMPLARMRLPEAGTATITLLAGGAAVTGKLNATFGER